MVVALVALTAALAGTAIAATKIGTKNIKRGAVTTKKIAGGAVTAKKLDPAAGNQFVRAAAAAVTDPVLTGAAANTIVASTTIVAPQAGFLQITASADAFSSGNDAGIACTVVVDGNAVLASRRVLLNTGAATFDDHIDNCATNVTVPAAPGPHIVGLEFSGVDGASVARRTVDVLFVAFGPNG